MELAAVALEAATAGATVVGDAFGTAVAHETKGDDSPVTEVDRLAERAVLAVITATRPDDAIVSEEGAGGEGGSGFRWYVDPLDGTVNFIHGIPHVATSVAVYDGSGAVAAAVVDAVRGEAFTATRGGGTRLAGRPVTVSSQAVFRQAVVATGFPYDHRQHVAEYLAPVAAVLETVQGVRRMGSAALDLAWVAAGRYEGFFEFVLGPWDLAAGLLLVTEADGRVTDWQGRPAGPGTYPVIASNGVLHDDLLAAVGPTVPDRLRRTSPSAG